MSKPGLTTRGVRGRAPRARLRICGQVRARTRRPLGPAPAEARALGVTVDCFCSIILLLFHPLPRPPQPSTAGRSLVNGRNRGRELASEGASERASEEEQMGGRREGTKGDWDSHREPGGSLDPQAADPARNRGGARAPQGPLKFCVCLAHDRGRRPISLNGLSDHEQSGKGSEETGC